MFDAHAHPGKNYPINALVCSASTADFGKLLPFQYKAIGAIPEGGYDVDFSLMAEAASNGWNIGEIGLDRRFPDIDKQMDIFRTALSIAREYDRIAVIHIVREYQNVYDMLKDMGIRRFIVHGYTGSAEMAKEYIKLGGIISLGPSAEKAKSFPALLSLPFVTETDMMTGSEEVEALAAWNSRLSALTGIDAAARTEKIMMEALG